MKEKGELPLACREIQKSEKGTTDRKFTLAVLFYAVAVTATLITMAILGPPYVQKLSYFRQQELTINGERVVVDPVANKEVIYPSGEGLQGSIIVIDHNKGIIGMYMAATEECFIIDGVDTRLPNATELLAALQSENGADLDPEIPVSLKYVKASDWPAQNVSQLPSEIRAHCFGKHVFLLARRHEGQVQSGQTGRERGNSTVVFNILIWYKRQLIGET